MQGNNISSFREYIALAVDKAFAESADYRSGVLVTLFSTGCVTEEELAGRIDRIEGEGSNPTICDFVNHDAETRTLARGKERNLQVWFRSSTSWD